MEVRVASSGRLHLGFMDLHGGLRRLFGSIGVSISAPVTEISIKPHPRLSIHGATDENRKKLSEIVRKFSTHFKTDANVSIRVHRSIPKHKGLGSGTQLALTATTAMAQLFNIKTNAHDLSMITGRGLRSSIGIHGFTHGGLIVDSGKRVSKNGAVEAAPPKAVMTYKFPEEWRFVLIIPEEKQGLSGEEEKKAIGFLHPSEKISEEICRLVLMKLLPSLIEKDIEEFGRALTAVDEKTGLFFKPVQGGIYSEKWSQNIIDHLLASGAYGVGQSSWGPTIYGLTSTEEAGGLAQGMRVFLERHKIEGTVLICSGRNRGADIKKVELNNTKNHKLIRGLSSRSFPYVYVDGSSG